MQLPLSKLCVVPVTLGQEKGRKRGSQQKGAKRKKDA